MKLWNTVLGILDYIAREDYLETSKEWFDSSWKRFNNPYCGDGILIIKHGCLYRQLRVTFGDEKSVTLIDDKDEGCDLQSVKLKQYQEKELINKGYFILKHYHP